MTEPRRQGRRAFIAVPAVLALALAASLGAPAPVAAHDPEPAGIDTFLRALGQVESGGNYYARNTSSGAYGKYQIMPSNWPGWAEKYLGDASAPMSPTNQEIVAKGKVHDLHHWLGSWPVVAHWWLTGSSSKDVSSWSSYSRSYVDKVMTLYAQYGGAAASLTTVTSSWIYWQESQEKLLFAGGWSRAYSSGYSGGYVKYSNIAGARLTFRFTGTAFQWVGPKGPTRGKAHVYVNNVLAGTVDLYSSSFRARQVVFQRTYARAVTREVRIVVAGTKGRPTVAVDTINLRR